MPVPTTISGQAMLGFSNPSTFFVGYSPSYLNVLRGLGWSMTIGPAFKTLEAMTAGGREVRNGLYLNPLHQFKLTFNFLENDPDLDISTNPILASDFQNLYSFYLAMNGKAGEFLYQSREAAVVHGPLAAPDANGYVEIVYSTGPFFSLSVQELNGATPTIYSVNDGVYTDRTNDCTFFAPASISPYTGICFSSTYTLSEGESFVWSGSWYYRLHFAQDNLSFEEFLYQVMKTGVTLQEVRI